MVNKTEHRNFGCGFFAYSWKLPAYSGAFLLTVYNFRFFAYSWSSFAYNFSFLTYSWSFFAYSGEVRLIRASRDCKQKKLNCKQKSSNCKEMGKQWPTSDPKMGLWPKSPLFRPFGAVFPTCLAVGKFLVSGNSVPISAFGLPLDGGNSALEIGF